ncbi:hypothetical protein [Streptomyces mayonensis]|uniref:hypothetical protein n=1 Tax=Streptomyces mayonensis TaxID=2750816 RepID=UPI001C1DE61A|nr:hypothetical protein [Streptomyces sp. A108]
MTMAHHALEITLARPLAAAELHHAARTMPLAPNRDATRLMTVVRAKTPGKALTGLRRQIGTRLPVDVLTTHYPDRSGEVLLNVAFAPAAHTALRAAADQAAQTPQRFLELAVHRALAQHADAEADRLGRALQHLLAHTTPVHLLAAVGHCLTRTSGAAPC